MTERTGLLIFRQLFDSGSSTYTYLLGDKASGTCAIIDPVYEKYDRDLKLIRELGLELAVILDTHCHADHITAAWFLKQKTKAKICISKASRVLGADRNLQDGDIVHFGDRSLRVLATPGHTAGCLTYLLDDSSMAFTGDALLIRGCGRTDFQEGDPNVLYQSINEKIFTLPDDTRLFPGHDYNGFTESSVAEEKQFNRRLSLEVSETDFKKLMMGLKLDLPKKINDVLPSNMRSGELVTEVRDSLEKSRKSAGKYELWFDEGSGI